MTAVEAEVLGPVAVVALDGELDAFGSSGLADALVEAPGADVVALVLDLSGVTYLDSAGVHLLLDVHRRLARRGYALHVVRPRRRTPALVLEVTDVGAGVPVHPHREAALAALEA